MGRIRKGKLLQRQKGRYRLQQTQQSNSGRQARQRLMKNKQNLKRRLILLRQNSYPTMIRRENNIKWAVKLHRSVNKRKQRRQRGDTKRHAARNIKIRVS